MGRESLRFAHRLLHGLISPHQTGPFSLCSNLTVDEVKVEEINMSADSAAQSPRSLDLEAMEKMLLEKGTIFSTASSPSAPSSNLKKRLLRPAWKIGHVAC
jgi:hypothetical protein